MKPYGNPNHNWKAVIRDKSRTEADKLEAEAANRSYKKSERRGAKLKLQNIVKFGSFGDDIEDNF